MVVYNKVVIYCKYIIIMRYSHIYYIIIKGGHIILHILWPLHAISVSIFICTFMLGNITGNFLLISYRLTLRREAFRSSNELMKLGKVANCNLFSFN